MENIGMGFNTRLNDFKADIVELATKSNLPIGSIYYIVKDFLYDIEKAYKDSLKIEKTVLEQEDIKNYQE